MQNNLYVYIMGGTAFIVLLNFLYGLKVKTFVGRMVSGILFSALIILLTYIVALFSENSAVADLFYSIYFVANTLISLFSFLFSGAYLGRKKLPVWGRIILAVIVAIDCASLMLNPVFHHEVVYQMNFSGGILSRVFRPLPPFYLHLAVCYLLLGTFFINFFIEMIRSPLLYKMQYAVILFVSLVCIVGNAAFLIVKFDVDISVIFYGFMAVLLYYFTFEFLPRKLTFDMGQVVLREMNAAVLFYDLKGKCIYRNKCAESCFAGNITGETLSVLADQLGIEFRKDQRYQSVAMNQKGERHLYRVGYQQLNDRQVRYMGCFLVLEDITAEKKQEEIRKYLTTHDTLTGIYNQAAFYAEARDLINRYTEKPYCIITTNVKQFKLLNDFLGKETCDGLLKSIAKGLMQLKREDIVFGRLESDRFAICAPEEYHLEEEFPIKFDLIHSLDDFPIGVVMCFGIYQVVEKMLPISIMCDRANMALASVKDDESVRIAYYDEKLREKMLRENRLIAQIPNAIENREFEVYYQPQIDSRTDTMVGAEALVRWKNPEEGMLLPLSFIPLLERTGLIYQLDLYVWDLACRQIAELQQLGYNVPVSVNISRRDFYSGDVYHDLTGLVSHYHISPEQLNLEITESAMILDSHLLCSLVSDLQRFGFTVEMDDFGSGSSSLNTLKDIPVNILKMDMLFLDDSHDVVRSHKIIKLVSDLAKSLNIPLIAEGVSRKEQADYLATIGCHYLQGFYYARPVPYEEFKGLLQKYPVRKLK